jgi:hypothetical protein
MVTDRREEGKSVGAVGRPTAARDGADGEPTNTPAQSMSDPLSP